MCLNLQGLSCLQTGYGDVALRPHLSSCEDWNGHTRSEVSPSSSMEMDEPAGHEASSVGIHKVRLKISSHYPLIHQWSLLVLFVPLYFFFTTLRLFLSTHISPVNQHTYLTWGTTDKTSYHIPAFQALYTRFLTWRACPIFRCTRICTGHISRRAKQRYGVICSRCRGTDRYFSLLASESHCFQKRRFISIPEYELRDARMSIIFHPQAML